MDFITWKKSTVLVKYEEVLAYVIIKISRLAVRIMPIYFPRSDEDLHTCMKNQPPWGYVFTWIVSEGAPVRVLAIRYVKHNQGENDLRPVQLK